MKHYALIFRATRTLTPEEVKQRASEIGSWAKEVTEMGIELDPRNFGAVVANLSAQGGEVVSSNDANDPSLGTIVFFDAQNSDKALQIARIHPGLHYGVTVEVREWTSPREAAAKP